jgi:hypothetical protein
MSARGLLTLVEKSALGLPVAPLDRLSALGFGEIEPEPVRCGCGDGDCGIGADPLPFDATTDGSSDPERWIAEFEEEELELDDEIASDADSTTAFVIAASRLPTGPTSIFNCIDELAHAQKAQKARK